MNLCFLTLHHSTLLKDSDHLLSEKLSAEGVQAIQTPRSMHSDKTWGVRGEWSADCQQIPSVTFCFEHEGAHGTLCKKACHRTHECVTGGAACKW